MDMAADARETLLRGDNWTATCRTATGYGKLLLTPLDGGLMVALEGEGCMHIIEPITEFDLIVNGFSILTAEPLYNFISQVLRRPRRRYKVRLSERQCAPQTGVYGSITQNQNNYAKA